MNKRLPDVASNEAPKVQTPLEWVGMSRIDVPMELSEPGCPGPVHVVVDALVNLPAVTVKGIHMSRIYTLVDSMARQETVTPGHLRGLLEKMVESHHDCDSDSARVVLDFSLLARRPALRTLELAGWKSYPVRLQATLDRNGFSLRASVQVEYSSTCPCSAALARQLIAEGFRESFSENTGLTREDVAVWLEQHASLATPHSQRSEACVSVDVPGSAGELGLIDLVDQVEAVLATPVQTAVKRADEQAFAFLNGQNLMYVEDAARRIQSALSGHYDNLRAQVRHMESLHSHDAVAFATGGFQPMS